MELKRAETAEAACSRGSPGGETAFWRKKFLIVVTGASGGIGRGIAASFAEHVAKGSLLVITGRNTAGLEETKRIIAALGREVNVSVETCDHSRALFRDYQDLLERASARLPDPDRVVLVHNAATIGNCSDYAVSYDDERAIGDYYRLNLTSVMTLTAAFLRRYDSDSGPTRTIVNVSSIGGIMAVPKVGLYCTGKAAREMFMRVVAAENPSVTVCSYDPGAVATAMLKELFGSQYEGTKLRYKVKTGTVISPEVTAGRLIRILEHGNFKSGDHVRHSEAP
ncbi:sepiapterin reductase-like [Ixodes scapularis]|uniref:sepiapterin reductase-like n=1 Tax=Ixodes scapularis TaxID=6945 RepID=UPI001A9E5534|nr:sepiapterin reductase-like [Ixodes scapularis]